MSGVNILCHECGGLFSVRPYRGSTAKYCSNSCQKRGSGRARRGHDAVSKDGRAKVTAAVKAAHKEGRCAPCISESANCKRGASLKRTWERDGSAWQRMSPETQRRLNDERRGRMTGKAIPSGQRNSSGPNHFAAKFWLLRTPDRNLVVGPNLNSLIRRHIHLFRPGDVAEPIGRSRARKGLNALFEVRRRDGQEYILESWKGWTAVNKAEMVKNVGVPFHRLKFKPTLTRPQTGLIDP